VTEITPQDGAEMDELRPMVRLRFDRTMDADSVARRFHLTPETPGRLVWPDPRTAVFQFTAGLAPDTAYTARLDAGATDAQGMPIQKATVWSWRTLGLVQSHAPTRGAMLVEPGSALKLSFRYPVDHAAAQAAWHVEPSVRGAFSWVGNTLIFTPAQPLEPDSDYRVRFDGVTVNGATPAGATAWAFHTRAAVLRVNVRKNSAGLEGPVTIEFDRAMDQTSVGAALRVSPPTPITLAWEGNTVTLRPEEEWITGASYAVTLARTARAADGSYPLKQDYRWTFQTVKVDRELGFGQGPNAQIVDADGRRALQIVARGLTKVDLALYSMTLPQFLDRYSSSFRGVGPEEHKGVSTVGLTRLREWQAELDHLEREAAGSGRPPGVRCPPTCRRALAKQEVGGLLKVATRSRCPPTCRRGFMS
jgi:hypothetical protein